MRSKRSVFRYLVLVSQFGINMVVPILLCTFLGTYIGEKLAMPILVIPMFFAGALAGFKNVYILAKKMYEDKGDGNVKKD